MLIRSRNTEGLHVIRFAMALSSYWPAVLVIPYLNNPLINGTQKGLIGIGLLLSLALTGARLVVAGHSREYRKLNVRDTIFYRKGHRIHRILMVVAFMMAAKAPLWAVIGWLLFCSVIAYKFNLHSLNPLLVLVGYRTVIVNSSLDSESTWDCESVLLICPKDDNLPCGDVTVMRITDNVYLYAPPIMGKSKETRWRRENEKETKTEENHD